MFSSEFCKIFKNTHFEEYLQTAASVNNQTKLYCQLYITLARSQHILAEDVRGVTGVYLYGIPANKLRKNYVFFRQFWLQTNVTKK